MTMATGHRFGAGKGMEFFKMKKLRNMFHSDQNLKHMNIFIKSSSVPIPLNIKNGSYNDNFFYSKLWAGPAYSNSPPPSSLPIPKFSIKPKRTVSLNLPSISAADIDFLTHVTRLLIFISNLYSFSKNL